MNTKINAPPIQVRGCRVHNLKGIDVSLPRGELIVLCGLSGSGKTSLALDTLYAEGQRCYIESFSTYTRQYLDRIDKPDCDAIENIPPAIAVTRASATKNNRSTVATATEIADHVRLLFAKAAQLVCHGCGQAVRVDDPQTIATQFANATDLTRVLIGFEIWLPNRTDASEILLGLQQEGYVRVICKGATHRLSDDDRSALAKRIGRRGADAIVVVDRLGRDADVSRWTESLETAMSEGNGRAVILYQQSLSTDADSDSIDPLNTASKTTTIDDDAFHMRLVSDQRRCEACDLDFPEPVPRLFNFNHPLGACGTCEGFGDVIGIDMNRVVPDPSMTLREGAIAPWNSPAYEHEWEELMALADDVDLPVDVPYAKLKKRHLKIIHEGSPKHRFGGLNGFFAWLDRKKYKMHVRIFAARYRSYRPCPSCGGKRFCPEALAYQIAGRDVSEVLSMRCDQADRFLETIALDSGEAGSWQGDSLDDAESHADIAVANIAANGSLVAEAPTTFQISPSWELRQNQIAAEPIRQIRDRLAYLRSVGLDYLQLDRTLRTLSGGETQRIALTAALGSTLVGMLYVLDEPTAGLHPNDVDNLIKAITRLRDRGNTVLAVEHNEQVMRVADRIIEIGPGAGVGGGEVVFEGDVDEMINDDESLTGNYLSQRQRSFAKPRPATGHLKLRGASGRNLKHIDVDFPLGNLCVVTGRSGSGKSTLIHDTLFGAVRERVAANRGESKPTADHPPLPIKSLHGCEAIDDVMLVDQSPISRSPRSCPITFAKAFDPIRKLFAETVDARIRNFKPGHFSFNSASGQCDACEGAGVQTVDMQFLADVSMTCPECRGRRYRDDVLEVRYRDLTIADVLEMTLRDAYSFFRDSVQVQAKLKRLIDVGLDYVALGQPATTLSSGEAQRLKLAAFLASSARRKTLFLMDEPTTGLHFSDIEHLIGCFDALIADGHSLIVVEHHPMMMRAADHVIEIGPGAAEAGGEVVAAGPPQRLAEQEIGSTGRILA
ncbi:MAG: excinuclease ABC subunit UvrA [Planctomycetota bacterium]